MLQSPIGAMLPYFGEKLPQGNRWVWADGKTNWPVDEWVPEPLRGHPVPDMTTGLLVGGVNTNLAVGAVWTKGVVQVPQTTVDVSQLKIKSLADFKGPLGPGNHQNLISKRFSHPFFYYLVDKTRPTERDKPGMPPDVSPEMIAFTKETGLGPRPFGRGHPNEKEENRGFWTLTDDWNFISLAVDLGHFGQAGASISGAASVPNVSIPLNDSGSNPPYLATRWIIRIR